MKKILLVTPKLETSGGVASYWNSLIPLLKENRDLKFENFQVGGHGKNIIATLKEQYIFRKKITNNSLVFLNPSLGFNSFFRDGFFAKQLIYKNIPFVVFFHGWNLNFEKKVTEKYQNFFLNSFAKAKIIFVLSPEFKTTLIKWGYKGEIIVETTNINSNLISNFNFSTKLDKLDKLDKIKILFLARMLKEKGIFETIDAFINLEKKYPFLELIIAGDGIDLEEVKERTKNIKNIKILGHIEGREKIECFTNCHIYCLPSYSEGLPTSILEALAFGLTIITTKVGGLKYFFKDPQMGKFVNIKDSKDLENTIEQIIINKKELKERALFNHNFALKELLDTTVSLRINNHIMNILKERDA